MVVPRHVRRAPRMERMARLRRGRPGPATLPHALTALLQSSRRLVLRHHNLLRCTSRDTHCSSIEKNRRVEVETLGHFIYIPDSSNSSSIPFWTSNFSFSTRSNLTGNSNGSWTYTQSAHSKRNECKRYILFHIKTTTNEFWNNDVMLLKSFWTSHLQMMNWLEPLF